MLSQYLNLKFLVLLRFIHQPLVTTITTVYSFLHHTTQNYLLFTFSAINKCNCCSNFSFSYCFSVVNLTTSESSISIFYQPSSKFFLIHIGCAYVFSHLFTQKFSGIYKYLELIFSTAHNASWYSNQVTF